MAVPLNINNIDENDLYMCRCGCNAWIPAYFLYKARSPLIGQDKIRYSLWSYVCSNCGLPADMSKTLGEIKDIIKKEEQKKPRLVPPLEGSTNEPIKSI